MEVSFRDLITIIHGMGFGALFMLAFSGAIGVGGGSPKTDDDIARITLEEMGAMKPANAAEAGD